MRSKALLLLLGLLAALPARANKLTAIPKLVGRTARNMVTFRDKQAAIEQWLCITAAVGDGITSWHDGKILPNVHESNPIFGPNPSLGTYMALLIPMGFGEATLTQYAHEQFDSFGPKHYQWWATLAPATASVSVHLYGITSNESLIRSDCRTAGIVCR